MSTAGKVLVVLNLLLVLVWMGLASTAAMLNRNWGQQIADTQTWIAQNEPKLPDLYTEIDRKKSEINLVQVQKDNDLTNIRDQVSKLEKDDALTKESLARFTLQLETMQAAVAKAQARHEVRKKEKEETEKALAETRQLVVQLGQENDALLAQLTGLRTDFVRTLARNKEMIRTLLRAEATGSRRNVRPAVRSR
jgi:chromosome segregation ATPase